MYPETKTSKTKNTSTNAPSRASARASKAKKVKQSLIRLPHSPVNAPWPPINNNTRSKKSRSLYPEVEDAGPNDVVCGRGCGNLGKSEGNLAFRQLVEMNIDKYEEAEKQCKVHISRMIVAEIRKRNGKFLLYDLDNRTWNDMTDKKAVEKTSQTFRDLRSKPYVSALEGSKRTKPKKNHQGKPATETSTSKSSCPTAPSNVAATTVKATKKDVPRSMKRLASTTTPRSRPRTINTKRASLSNNSNAHRAIKKPRTSSSADVVASTSTVSRSFSQSSSTLEEIAIEPQDTDILFGRCANANANAKPHPGNRAFLQAIHYNQKRYFTSSNEQADQLCHTIVSTLLDEGARFLEMDPSTKLWTAMDWQQAVTRTSNGFKLLPQEAKQRATAPSSFDFQDVCDFLIAAGIDGSGVDLLQNHTGLCARATDVIAGSSVHITVTKLHPGNQAFAWIIDQHHALYTCSTVRSEKLHLSETIVATIQSQGGRFLQQNTTTRQWSELNSFQAVALAAHALRRGLRFELGTSILPGKITFRKLCLQQKQKQIVALFDTLPSLSRESTTYDGYPESPMRVKGADLVLVDKVRIPLDRTAVPFSPPTMFPKHLDSYNNFNNSARSKPSRAVVLDGGLRGAWDELDCLSPTLFTTSSSSFGQFKDNLEDDPLKSHPCAPPPPDFYPTQSFASVWKDSDMQPCPVSLSTEYGPFTSDADLPFLTPPSDLTFSFSQ
jgi:hypothetical protein